MSNLLDEGHSWLARHKHTHADAATYADAESANGTESQAQVECDFLTLPVDVHLGNLVKVLKYVAGRHHLTRCLTRKCLSHLTIQAHVFFVGLFYSSWLGHTGTVHRNLHVQRGGIAT